MRAEHELRRTELTAEGTLYQMRSKAFSLWRTNLWTPALLPNKLHQIRLRVLLPFNVYVPAAIRQGTVFEGIGRKLVDHHGNHDRLGRVQPHIGGALDCNAFVVLFLEGLQRLRDDCL